MKKELRKKSVNKAVRFTLSAFACTLVTLALRAWDDFGFSGPAFLVLGVALGLVMTYSAVLGWANVSQGSYIRNIKVFVEQSPNPILTMDRLERTWKNGVQITKALRVDDEYFLFGDGTNSAVAPWSDVLSLSAFTMSRSIGSRHATRYKHVLGVRLTRKNGDATSALIVENTAQNRATPLSHFDIATALFNYVEENHSSISVTREFECMDERVDRIIESNRNNTEDSDSNTPSISDAIDWDSLKGKE